MDGLQAETLSKEAGDLEAAIDAEVKLRAESGAGGGSAAAAVEGEVPAVNGVSFNDAAAAAVEAGQGHEPSASVPAPETAAPAEEGTDALDAFMSDMAKQAEADKVCR